MNDSPQLPSTRLFTRPRTCLFFSGMDVSRTWIGNRARVDSEREERGSLCSGQHGYVRCEPGRVTGVWRRAVRRLKSFSRDLCLWVASWVKLHPLCILLSVFLWSLDSDRYNRGPLLLRLAFRGDVLSLRTSALTRELAPLWSPSLPSQCGNVRREVCRVMSRCFVRTADLPPRHTTDFATLRSFPPKTNFPADMLACRWVRRTHVPPLVANGEHLRMLRVCSPTMPQTRGHRFYNATFTLFHNLQTPHGCPPHFSPRSDCTSDQTSPMSAVVYIREQPPPVTKPPAYHPTGQPRRPFSFEFLRDDAPQPPTETPPPPAAQSTAVHSQDFAGTVTPDGKKGTSRGVRNLWQRYRAWRKKRRQKVARI